MLVTRWASLPRVATAFEEIKEGMLGSPVYVEISIIDVDGRVEESTLLDSDRVA